MNNIDFYGKLYEYCWPISFLALICILIGAGITQNPNILIIGGIIIILFDIFCMLYIWLYPFEHLKEKFILWIHSFNKYKLSENEIKLWNSIINKADLGYHEWLQKTHGEDMCGPWIKDYTDEENKLIDKIHTYFYGKHWYIVMPISGSQVNYIKYCDIKNKVK